MVLTREERERFVLDLYDEGKSIREIAEEARMSFRDIGVILNKAMEEKETSKEQAEKMSPSTQAYKLFSEGKSPVQVAIALNIREPEVASFYVEYWNLMQYQSLSRIYEEIKDGIGYFVRLYRLARVARMGVEQVVKVLEIANNDLPLVEHKFERLKREVDDLEANKHNSARILQEISDQITYLRKICKEQSLELTRLQMRKIKLEGLVDSFQNNNEEYDKIRNTAEDKVVSILSNSKMLLKSALLSLTESLRKDPDRYSSLIYHNSTSSNTDYNSQNYETASYTYGQQQHHPSQDYISMLIEESEKLYTSLKKEWEDKIITDYTFSITSSSALPLLPSSDEKERQSHQRQTTAAIQSNMDTAEHRYLQSEIDNEDKDS
jgi:hypothetical protein